MSGVLWGEKPMHQLCDSFLILIPFHYIFLCYTTHTHTHMDAVWCQQQLQFNQCHSSHICLIEASHITHTHTPSVQAISIFSINNGEFSWGKKCKEWQERIYPGKKRKKLPDWKGWMELDLHLSHMLGFIFIVGKDGEPFPKKICGPFSRT